MSQHSGKHEQNSLPKRLTPALKNEQGKHHRTPPLAPLPQKSPIPGRRKKYIHVRQFHDNEPIDYQQRLGALTETCRKHHTSTRNALEITYRTNAPVKNLEADKLNELHGKLTLYYTPLLIAVKGQETYTSSCVLNYEATG